MQFRVPQPAPPAPPPQHAMTHSKVVVTGDESAIRTLLHDLAHVSDHISIHDWRVVDAGNAACVEISLDREKE